VIEVHTDTDRSTEGSRILDRAEGVLVGIRRCTIDAAFEEIVGVSQRHNVPAFQIAHALVELAQGKNPGDDDAAAVAREEWSDLLSRVT
jgi:AmiR/NasT family two-component response regulator